MKASDSAMSLSALYSGHVQHQRLRPLRHHLRYRVFSLLLDIDELPTLHRRLRLFSLDRFNVFSLRQTDYGDGRSSLRDGIDRQLRAAALPAGGRVALLTMPRMLGYAFNPLSVYFCHAPGSGELMAIVYEVNNTFGERHSYLITVDAEAGNGGVIHQRCGKQLHVSPFLPLDMQYRFSIDPPDAQRSARVGVAAHDDTGPVLTASLHARRRPLTDKTLAAAFVVHPLLTLKVIAAIHWEALRLLIKGLRPRRKPAPPALPVTVITRPEDA